MATDAETPALPMFGRRGALRTLSVALAAILIVGCGETSLNPSGGSTLASRKIPYQDVASQLGLRVVREGPTGIVMANESNCVVLYPDPGGRAFVNGVSVGPTGGFVTANGALHVPEETINEIRTAMIIRRPLPPVVPAQAPVQVATVVRKPTGGRSAQAYCIVVDAGHGGKDPGNLAAGAARPEKDLNLAVAMLVSDALERRGAKVVVTRSNDTFVELDDRVRVVNRTDPDLFISIHSDMCRNPSISGHVILTPEGRTPQSERAADEISRRMIDAGSPEYAVRQDNRNLRVLNKTTCPAVLVELGFLSNRQEASRLFDGGFQQRAAEAIADGIIAFLESK